VAPNYLQPHNRGKEEEKIMMMLMMMAVLYSQNFNNKVLCIDRLFYCNE